MSFERKEIHAECPGCEALRQKVAGLEDRNRDHFRRLAENEKKNNGKT